MLSPIWSLSGAELGKAFARGYFQDGGVNKGDFNRSFEKYYTKCTTGTLPYVSGSILQKWGTIRLLVPQNLYFGVPLIIFTYSF